MQAPQNPASTTPKTTAEPSVTDEQPSSESQTPEKHLDKEIISVPSDDVDVMSQPSYSLTVHVS